MNVVSVALGFILDLIIGDPYRLPHPIRWIGSFIALQERAVRKVLKGSMLILGGAVITALTLGISIAVTVAILHIAYGINRYLGILTEAVVCFYMLALKSLKKESMAVCHALEKGDRDEARRLVSKIVGRDTDRLDEKGIARAAVETVAENTSDGVIAPLFYMLIFGGVGGVAYKAVNTLDSMLGYKDEKYFYIGKIPARLDDLVNFIPARLSAFFMLIGAFILGYDVKNAVRIFIRDRYKHKSPNSAQTESVCAGALGLRLAGDAYYFGRLYKKPAIGDDINEICPEDIERADRLLYAAAFMTIITGVIIRLVILWLRQ